jgi:hypothetical protein
MCFRLIRKIGSQNEPPVSGMVWDLFPDKAALTFEVTSTVQSQGRYPALAGG